MVATRDPRKNFKLPGLKFALIQLSGRWYLACCTRVWRNCWASRDNSTFSKLCSEADSASCFWLWDAWTDLAVVVVYHETPTALYYYAIGGCSSFLSPETHGRWHTNRVPSRDASKRVCQEHEAGWQCHIGEMAMELQRWDLMTSQHLSLAQRESPTTRDEPKERLTKSIRRPSLGNNPHHHRPNHRSIQSTL